MCCGKPDEPGRYDELAAEGRRGEGVMARVFTTVPGAVIRIGNHGAASNDVPCDVPENVADELASSSEFRIERGAASAPAAKLTAEDLKKASGGKGKD